MNQPHLFKNAILLLSLISLSIVGGKYFLKQGSNNISESKAITDTSHYREIRHQLWLKKDVIKHFPKEIPADAKGVRLAYSRSFLQGGSFFQVRLKQPQEKIKNLLSQYRDIAIHKYQGGNTNEHSNQTNGVPTTFFYTSDSGEESFPTSYEILVLGANNRGSHDFKWNHGDSYGVAIDSSTSEIVYWAEAW
jgi:hypothetical protein